jgi:hypothetical protein
VPNGDYQLTAAIATHLRTIAAARQIEEGCWSMLEMLLDTQITNRLEMGSRLAELDTPLTVEDLQDILNALETEN